MFQRASAISNRVRPAVLALAAIATAAIAIPIHAQDRAGQSDDPGAKEIAKTPLTDLNLAKDPIPALLLEAEENPYDLTGLDRCAALIAAVEDLNAILGPDLDLLEEEERGIRAGKVAQSVVGSFIPFRGLVREASGAASQQRKFANAIMAGAVRRGFLKGIGRTRGCASPARPASAQEKEAYQAEQARLRAEEVARKEEERNSRRRRD